MIEPIALNTPWVRGRLLFCAFVSGTAGLTYEVLWNRDFLLVFGSTTTSAAALLAAFMAGLALGAAAVARWGARIRSPLRLYAIMEGSVALYAVGFSKILHLTNWIMASGWGDLISEVRGLALVVGGAPLLIPTVAMGAGLPLLAFTFDMMRDRRAGTPALLYGLNTLGAVAGAMGAGFLFLPTFGMKGTLAAAVILSLTAAGVALTLQVRGERGATVGRPKGGRPSGWQRVLPGVLIISGACALGYEVIWTRILILILGSSTYAFSLTVAVFIFGTSVGSLAMKKRMERLRSPQGVFSHLQLATGLTAVAGLFLYGQLPGLYLRLATPFPSFEAMLFPQVLLIALVMLPPTILMGASFPVAVRLTQVEGSYDIGKPFSMALWWISVGNVVGVLMASLILLPALGLQSSVLALAVGNGLAGLVVALFHTRFYFRIQTLAIGISLFLVVGIFSPRWNPIIMTSGVYAKAPVFRHLAGSEDRLRRILDLYRLRFYREGMESVVSVVEMPTLRRTPHLTLAVDGKVDASTGKDMSTQVLSGHLPFIFHPSAKDVLVIGLASGITAGAVSAHPVTTITCMEIEPSMEEAARLFESFNHGVLDDPRVTLVFDDGRHALGLTQRFFDVIISEPSNPWMSGPSRLFTVEFFDLVRHHLNPAGVFAQWLPIYGLSPDLLKSLIGSFTHVFPHAVAFRVSEGDLLLLGSEDPPRLYRELLVRIFEMPGAKSDLERIGIRSAGDFLSLWVGGPRALKTTGAGVPLNTDNNGRVEFGAPRFLQRSTLSDNLFLLETMGSGNELINILDSDFRTKQGVEILVDGAEALTGTGRHDLALALAGLLEKSGASGAGQYIRMSVGTSGDSWIAGPLVEPWGQRAAVRRAEDAILRHKFEFADEILQGFKPGGGDSRTLYLKGILALWKESPGKARTYFGSVREDSLGLPGVFLPFFRWVAALRVGDTSFAGHHHEKFVQTLRELRQLAEREEGTERIDTLVEFFAPGKMDWLDPAVREEVEARLQRELLVPLAKYYKGVSLLFTGQFEEAAAVLKEAADLIPEGDTGSMVFHFLDVAREKMPGAST